MAASSILLLVLLAMASQAFAQVGIIGADTPVNYAPVAHPQEVTTAQGTPKTISLTGQDANGDALTFSIVTSPIHGSLSGFTPATGVVTYIPSGSFAGADSFTFSVDDVITESDPATVLITVTAAGTPDLVETAVSNPPGTAVVGGSFSVTDTVQNQGTVTAGATKTRYYLSLDTLRSSGDKRLTGNRSVPSLTAGAESMGTVTVTIPLSTVAGTYFLLACADDRLDVSESNESNNCRASATQVTVQVTGPDLIEPAVSNPPGTAALGGSFSVMDTVRNQGTGAAGASTTR
jgi:hypothetical protein